MSPGPEIQSYFSQVATERGIRPHIRFGTEVTSARYRDGQWWVGTSDGEEAFDVLIAATGVLRIPRYPDIRGLETFAGPSFHSSRWDHSVSLPDKRIGLIGTGSTGVQITAELGGNVKGLKIFQRTPQWVFPTPNLRYSRVSKAALARWPVLNKVSYRFWQMYIEHASLGRASGRTMLAAPHDDGVVPLEPAIVGARPRTAPQAHARTTTRCASAKFLPGTTTRPYRSRRSSRQ